MLLLSRTKGMEENQSEATCARSVDCDGGSALRNVRSFYPFYVGPLLFVWLLQYV